MSIKWIKKLNTVHYLWLFVLLISFVIQSAGWGEFVRYDRALIANGHYWLLLSGHFTHLNWAHWALNMGGLAIVAFFFSTYGNFWQWLIVIVLSAFTVGLGLFWFHPDIGWYVGLSGVLHGLFIFGVMREIKFYPLSGYVLFALLVSKLTWEKFFGALPGSEDMTGGNVITDAHLYGAIGGAMSILLFWFGLWLKKQSISSGDKRE